jgi:integrase
LQIFCVLEKLRSIDIFNITKRTRKSVRSPTYYVKLTRPAPLALADWRAIRARQFKTTAPVTIDRVSLSPNALALYFGHRRSDVARVKWTDLEAAATNVIQQKKRRNGRKSLWIPMHPELIAALEATPQRGDYVVLTQYGEPFSVKALGMRMQDWTRAAGIAPGHTLHGLRKALGKLLAESGATTRELMAILGHDDIAHAELYTREAEQKGLAAAGIRKLTKRGEPAG